ncbi:hypothetical protein PH5382_02128 [Phaeobacter sp. CECT 5382]|uniref:hypothetical protein n=1 Tax=Phaeobacter sp. CECT 5382 TaxID=1712645 RepID=UPI0006DB21E8|nr:hypothetical protein [Phaeobacter sp. CECT 5382]CUH88195.1 hypothetical protein PH5382_02128 [Phaeobacter sp. CECT 5382]
MTDVVISLALPLLVLLGSTWFSLHKGINLGDEGYLVYGTQAVLRGEVPVRDFRAYDPARYYWCALWCRLIGSEFIAIRIAMAVFSALSVCLISLLVLWATGNPVLGSLAGLASLLWMHPRHKQIEHFFSLVCCSVVFAVLCGLGQPFWLGVIGAVGAAFGLNILTYFIGSAVLSFALLWLVRGAAGLEALPGFVLGLLVGVAVLILIAALVPGFLRSYLDRKVLALLRRGTTNLALPKPWIWRAPPRQIAGFPRLRRLAVQALFTLMPVFYLAILVLAAQTLGKESLGKDQATLLASAASLCGLVYFHHAASRADLNHIHQVMQPFIVTLAAGMAATLPAPLAVVVLLLFGIASGALLWRTSEFSRTWAIHTEGAAPFVNGRDRFLIRQDLQRKLILQREVVHARSGPQDALFVAPALPALLALFHRKSAVYDTFPVYPASVSAQLRMIRELECSAPPLAIISKGMIDQREDLRFENNYSLVFDYLAEQYECLSETPGEYIFRRRDPAR